MKLSIAGGGRVVVTLATWILQLASMRVRASRWLPVKREEIRVWGREAAIEGWWRRLRQRLEETAPVKCEKRAEFLKRLRRTVTWLNVNCRADGRTLCCNQKDRANKVLLLKGAKCEWLRARIVPPRVSCGIVANEKRCQCE